MFLVLKFCAPLKNIKMLNILILDKIIVFLRFGFSNISILDKIVVFLNISILDDIVYMI